MFRLGGFRQNEGSESGNPTSESACYAKAFGKESIFKRKTPVIEANEKPEDELSTETRAYEAVAEGLLSSMFGPKK